MFLNKKYETPIIIIYFSNHNLIIVENQVYKIMLKNFKLI